MPGLNDRWQIFHIGYADGVVSRTSNDLDSYGSFSLGVGVTLRGIGSYQIFALQNGDSNAEQITRLGIRGEYGLAGNGGKMVYTTEKVEGPSALAKGDPGCTRQP
jgi:hypothetical protein